MFHTVQLREVIKRWNLIGKQSSEKAVSDVEDDTWSRTSFVGAGPDKSSVNLIMGFCPFVFTLATVHVSCVHRTKLETCGYGPPRNEASGAFQCKLHRVAMERERLTRFRIVKVLAAVLLHSPSVI